MNSLLKFLKIINRSSEINGLNVRKILKVFLSCISYFSDIIKYNQFNDSKYKLPLRIANLFPALGDKSSAAGVANGHYFHQDLWAARKIYQKNPDLHVDVGSSIEGFISHLLVFMKKVHVIDIRSLESDIENLTFIQSDATTLKELADNSVTSISSLHAAEHFGLGRYGDPIDPLAHISFMKSLARVLSINGTLYFSVPIGIERLEFNAQRVLSPYTVLQVFNASNLRLVSFSLVKDDHNLYLNADMDEASMQNYGCGLFEFTKDYFS